MRTHKDMSFNNINNVFFEGKKVSKEFCDMYLNTLVPACILIIYIKNHFFSLVLKIHLWLSYISSILKGTNSGDDFIQRKMVCVDSCSLW